jgi:lipopolysaccharide export system permease protein
MIVNRYIQRNIHLGTASALLLLVSLALFFTFVREIDNLGKGGYGIRQLLEYLALSVPSNVVAFLPLSVLLGSMLSLGSLASNSELIAMQASGITLRRMLGAVLQAGLLLALVSFLLSDWVVPDSEANARKIKNLDRQQTSALDTRQGLWLKDESKIVHVAQLLPNGYARKIEIFHLDEQGGLKTMIKAESAQPHGGGWELHQVKQTSMNEGQASSQQFEQLIYPGNLSHELLQVLLIEPRQMSSRNLFAYIRFLDENRLDAEVERLIFWQKMFAPVSIVTMCLLAFPFVLGSQRQSNAGQRLLIGILLGLSFVIVDQILSQLGTRIGANTIVIALMPNLLFLALAVFLLVRRSGQGAGRPLFSRFSRR